MDDKTVLILEQTGLTKAQAIVYLTLLKIGQTKIGVIIEKTSLQSSVVHNAINRLIELGLVNFVIIGKVRHYQTADPGVFLNYLDEKKSRIDEQKVVINSILPRLHLIKEHSKKKTEVEVYKGKKGFQTAFIEEYEKVERNKDTYFLAQPEEIHLEDDFLPVLWNKLNAVLIKKGCSIKGIGPLSLKKVWPKKYKEKNYSFKYVKENFPWDVNILPDCVIVSLWGEEPIAIKIKDEFFKNNAKRYFEEKWKEAKD